jgi:hypothetical protein
MRFLVNGGRRREAAAALKGVKQIGLYLYLWCNSSFSSLNPTVMPEPNLDPIGGYISPEEAKILIANYANERLAAMNEARGFQDSRSCTYTIDELIAFLQKAQAGGAQKLKICFGVYGKEARKNAGFTTAVLIPVAEDGTENCDLAYNSGSLCPPDCS